MARPVEWDEDKIYKEALIVDHKKANYPYSYSEIAKRVDDESGNSEMSRTNIYNIRRREHLKYIEDDPFVQNILSRIDELYKTLLEYTPRK